MFIIVGSYNGYIVLHCSILLSFHFVFPTLVAADQTALSGPTLNSYIIDMNSGEIVLTFSEPIDPSSMDITGITISGARGTTDPDLYHQLSSTSVLSVDSPNTARIMLSDADIDALQSRPSVATTPSNTFFSMERRTVTDRSNRHIMVQQISSTNALPPQTYVSDTTPPVMTSFMLDLDSNTMALTFSELVSALGPFTHGLQLSSQRDPTSGGVSYNLTYNEPRVPASRVIRFNLSLADSTFLESTPGIATSGGDTYLSAPGGIVADTSGLLSIELTPLSAHAVIEDTSPPSVVSFGLDLNTGTLDILFDDPINVTTFNPSAVTLQSAIAQRPMQWHTLSLESRSLYSNVTIYQMVQVVLSDSDLNQIKRIRSLCTDRHNCYMTTTTSVARHVNGIFSNAIPNGRGLMAAVFTQDQTPPQLVSWILDMNRGQITVTFSETVDITTLQYNQLILRNMSSSFGSSDTGLSLFSEVSPADASSVFTMQLRSSDVMRINRIIMLGTNVNNTYLQVNPGAIRDMNLNNLVAMRLQASDVIPDTTSPTLRHFLLNVYTGVIRLLFDEVVNVTSFNASGLTLTNRASAPTERYTLTGGSISYDTDRLTFIELTLNDADVMAINNNPNLANSRDASYMTAVAQTIQDMSQNQLTPILDNSALLAFTYVDSLRELSFQYSKYYVSEGQTAQIYVSLNTYGPSDATFTITTEDRQATGMFNALDSDPSQSSPS